MAVTRSTWIWCQFREVGSIADGCFGAPQAVTFEFDAVGIVKKAVEDSVGIGGIADSMMPRRGRKLAGHDGRLAAVPIFQDLEQIMPGLCIQRLKAPIIQDEQFDTGAWRAITEQIRAYDGLLRRRAAHDETTRCLMTVPGVGPIVALAVASLVDEPGRFAKSKSVGAYLDLTPRRYQSGKKDVTGSISRTGDTLVRSYLFEAANVLMTRVKRWTGLKAWGVKLARWIGMNRARAAVARKMGVMMHKMLLTNTDFRWGQEEAVAG